MVGASELRALVEARMARVHISNRERSFVGNELDLLAAYHPYTYEHCMRVGLFTHAIAAVYGLAENTALLSGTLHDIGKRKMPTNLLRVTGLFSPQERAEMAKHPELSYDLLHGTLPIVAEIAWRHHRFQPDPYPHHDPDSSTRYDHQCLSVFLQHAKFVSIADCFDSVTSRNHAGESPERNVERVKAMYRTCYPALAPKAVSLIDAGILHTDFLN